MRKKLTYSEGTWFAVPLREGGGFGVGVVARVSARGKIVLAYLFAGRLSTPPALAEVVQLGPANALRPIMVGDLGLMDGSWPIIGVDPQWDRTIWPMPEFARRDPISRRAWRIKYSDHDTCVREDESPVDYDAPLESDSLFGSGAAEKFLTKASLSVPLLRGSPDSGVL